MSDDVGNTALRAGSAMLVLFGGILHYQIWNSDYRDIPNGTLPGLNVVKVGFPVNAAVSLVLAILLIVLARQRIVWLAALLFELAAIGTLVLSREASVLGWQEPDWSTNAKKVLAVEVLAVVVLAVLLTLNFVRSHSRTESTPAQTPPELP